jgi:hypothetical protein
MSYRHTQPGTATLLICIVAGLFGAAATWYAGPASTTGLWIMLVVLIAVAVIFNSLTVEIEARELHWYFGPGWWTYRLALEEIDSAAVVRNHWWNGFGIRTARGFTLYNVSGLDAVELKLKSGDVKRIGTDDPTGLADALKSARGG